jgi:hypothetical protein
LLLASANLFSSLLKLGFALSLGIWRGWNIQGHADVGRNRLLELQDLQGRDIYGAVNGELKSAGVRQYGPFEA